MERQVAIGAGASTGIERLAELIRQSRSTVALTGAGVSVPSGIPDFRTPETGLWANVDPMEVAHIDVFERNPARFWSYYRRVSNRSATSDPTPPTRRLPSSRGVV